MNKIIPIIQREQMACCFLVGPNENWHVDFLFVLVKYEFVTSIFSSNSVACVLYCSCGMARDK